MRNFSAAKYMLRAVQLHAGVERQEERVQDEGKNFLVMDLTVSAAWLAIQDFSDAASMSDRRFSSSIATSISDPLH